MGITSHESSQPYGDKLSGSVLLASASYDHTIHFWDIAGQDVTLKTLQHPDSQVNSMCFTPDRSQLAVAGYQHIRLYDLTSWDVGPTVNFEGTKNFTGLGFETDGRWMYAGGEDCMVRIWDLRTSGGHCSKIFQARDPVNSVCLMPNQCEIIVGDQGGTVHVWDVRNDHNEQIIPEEECAAIQHLDVDPDGTMLAAVSNRGMMYVWNITQGSPMVVPQPLPVPQLSPELPAAPTPLVPEPEPPGRTNRTLTYQHANPASHYMPDLDPMMPLGVDTKLPTQTLHLTPPISPPQPSKMNPHKRQEAHKHYALRCRFSPDSTLLATCSAKNTASLWLTGADFELTAELSMPSNPQDQSTNQCWIWDCAFTADSQNLITCSSDHWIRLWSNLDGRWQFAKNIGNHQKAVTALAFSDVIIG